MPFLLPHFVCQGSDFHFSYDFLAFSPLILKPTQGAMSAVPPPSSKLGLLFFLRFSSNFASYIEGQSRCHFCGTVSFVKARTLNFLLGFSCNIASHTEARSRCHCCGTVSFVKARAFTLPKGFPAFSPLTLRLTLGAISAAN